MATNQFRVWDIYTRLFHWLLVIGIGYQYYSAKISNTSIDNHALVGYGLLGLIIWRVLWGFVGPNPVRFSHFVPSPKNLFRYLRTQPKPIYASHNPLGAFAVLLFLLMIALQSISGLFMTDDILFSGVLYGWLDDSINNAIQWFHNNSFNGLIALITLHVIAVIVHAKTSEPYIIKAMFHGKKPKHNYAVRHTLKLHLTCALCIVISALKVYLLVNHIPDWLGIEPEDLFDF